jgi:hypothetical protein
MRYLFAVLLLLAVPTLAQTTAKPKAPDAVDTLAKDLKPSRVLVYKKIAERELQLHVFEPEGLKAGDKHACYLIIHGGGWTGGAPPRMYPFAAHYAKLGLVGISMSYRLHSAKTGVSVFDCVKDARSAVRYIRATPPNSALIHRRSSSAVARLAGHLAVSTALVRQSERGKRRSYEFQRLLPRSCCCSRSSTPPKKATVRRRSANVGRNSRRRTMSAPDCRPRSSSTARATP